MSFSTAVHSEIFGRLPALYLTFNKLISSYFTIKWSITRKFMTVRTSVTNDKLTILVLIMLCARNGEESNGQTKLLQYAGMFV